jgi:GNAT superfamily N-acetyltransferase
MFSVRKMHPNDFGFAAKLANTVNWGMANSDFRFNAMLEPNGVFVLLDGLKRIGVATCISYGEVGWFGNLIIKQTHRKKGAGGALLNYVKDYLKSLDVGTVGLYAYPYLEDFYNRAGFKRDVDFVVMESPMVDPLPNNPIEFERISLKSLSDISEFDRACFGASRQKLFTLMFQESTTIGYVAFDESKLVGFAAAKVYDEVAEVGPIICRRDHAQTATELLNSVLCQLRGRQAYVYLPLSEEAQIDAASAAGFKEKFRLVRMFLGPKVAKNCIYSAESLERG